MGEDDFSWLTDFFGPQSDYPDPSAGGVSLGDVPTYTPSGGGGGGAGAFGVSGADNANAGAFANPTTWGGLSGQPQLGSNGLPIGTSGTGQRGLFTNPDGSVNWGSLLSILAPLAGGAYAANRTGAANQQMQDSIKQANAQITGLLGGNSALYAPYQAAGAQGLAGLMSQAPSNLASRYKPLGAGNGFSLGNIARGK